MYNLLLFCNQVHSIIFQRLSLEFLLEYQPISQSHHSTYTDMLRKVLDAGSAFSCGNAIKIKHQIRMVFVGEGISCCSEPVENL